MPKHNPGKSPKGETSERPFDVIVWGATGFTGRLVAEYFLRTYGIGQTVRWAIGGRSKDKLEEEQRALAAVDSRASALPLVVGDARDPESLAKMVTQTRVVLTTVGPYALYGKELVAACVEHGTDYCDLTGETPFVREMIDAHHDQAKITGARIVHCCGFDSIPSDLGVLTLQEHALATLGKPCSRVGFYVMKTKGGVSGGTIATMLNLVESATRDPSIRKVAGNPYALVPGERGPDGRDQMGVKFDEALGRWTGPFIMAAINTRIVRRSNALLGYRYGKDFRYSEVMSMGRGVKGWLGAAALSASMALFAGAISIGPTRRLLAKRVLPKPGEGPSKEKRDGGFFDIKLIGHSSDGRKVEAIVHGTSDPGYGETAKMISESAVCLALDKRTSEGGVLTPASAMGMVLVERLRAAGMTFTATSTPR